MAVMVFIGLVSLCLSPYLCMKIKEVFLKPYSVSSGNKRAYIIRAILRIRRALAKQLINVMRFKYLYK